MYGYIKPNHLELKVREHSFYKSLYCGLCRSLSKHTGGLSSITLSYDMTFFALIRMILEKETPKIVRKHCILHPISKRNIMVISPSLRYTAYVSSSLFHYKVKDDIKDESFFKKFVSYLIYPFSYSFYHRNKIKFVNETIRECMDKLSSLENEKCNMCDMYANVFGDMMGRLLSYSLKDNDYKIAYEIGLHTGRWLYLSDAICDYEKDNKKGRFNPYKYAFDNDEERQEYLSSGYQIVLNRELNDLRSCLDLLSFEYDELKACAYNIVDYGMNDNFLLMLKKGRGRKNEQSI